MRVGTKHYYFGLACILLFLMMIIREQKVHVKISKAIYKKLVFSEKRMRQIGNLFSFSSDKIVDIGFAKFYVPDYPYDLIQSTIVDEGTFYEIGILKKIDAYIKPNANILDIGANIGNHSIYWSVCSKAKKVYAFEPMKRTFQLLKKNVEINNLENKIKIFNFGLSDEEANASILNTCRNNIGGSAVKKDSEGDLKLRRLDDLDFGDEIINFIKIDTEGHEMQILNGARKFLKKHKPVIMIEAFGQNQRKVSDFLKEFGYYKALDLVDSNFLFCPFK